MFGVKRMPGDTAGARDGGDPARKVGIA